MIKRVIQELSLDKLDRYWVYSGLFGLALLLHYLTPYYQNQPAPELVWSVIIAPLREEIIYRLLGILLAVVSLRKIANSESLILKIDWGMVFLVAIYGEINSILLRMQIPNPFDFFLTLVLACIFLIVLHVFKERQLEIIMFTSSFAFAYVHESLRFIPVFVAGIFWSLLCVNRSRITLIDNQNKKTTTFLIIFGVFPGYLVHFWNNFLSWSLFHYVSPFFIDLVSFFSVIGILLLFEKTINQRINRKCKININKISEIVE